MNLLTGYFWFPFFFAHGLTNIVHIYKIDTIKTRLQSQAGFIASGGFRGVYSGLLSAVIGSAPNGNNNLNNNNTTTNEIYRQGLNINQGGEY